MFDFICPVKIDDGKRLKLLNQSLESLYENTPKDLINRVVLIDDMSSMKLEYDIVYRNDEQLGVGGSKNKGVNIHTKLGRGDYLYIFDGDVYFTKGWLEDMLEAYRRDGEEFLILGGGVHPYLQPRAGEDTELVTSHDAVSGWSWMLSYDVWDKYGDMADNALGVGKSEDWEYCQRIRNDGFKVGCLKKQVIAHAGLTNSEGVDIPGRDVSEILAKGVAPEAILL